MGNFFISQLIHSFWSTRPAIESRLHIPDARVTTAAHTCENDLLLETLHYAEWGRKIVHLPESARSVDQRSLKKSFHGLRCKSMIGCSTFDGRGVHDCLVNKRTGRIIGVTYNNRAEKLNILESVVPSVLAEIIVDCVWPPRISGMDPRLYQPVNYPRPSRLPMVYYLVDHNDQVPSHFNNYIYSRD